MIIIQDLPNHTRESTEVVRILQDLGWDTFNLSKRSKQLAIIVFKSVNNLYPESLKNVFKSTSGVHYYNVRGVSNNVFVPRPPIEVAQRAFSCGLLVMWNGVENVLKDEINLNVRLTSENFVCTHLFNGIHENLERLLFIY